MLEDLIFNNGGAENRVLWWLLKTATTQMSGTAAITISSTGTVNPYAALSGLAQITIDATGTISQYLISGTASIVMTAYGTILSPYIIMFGSVLLVGFNQILAAGKRNIAVPITLTDTIVLSGKHSVQTNNKTGWLETYSCIGRMTDYQSLLALVGQKTTLQIINAPYSSTPLTYVNCAIKSMSGTNETDNPNYYEWTITFSQETI